MVVNLRRIDGKMIARITGAIDDDPGVLLRCAGWQGFIDEIDYNGFVLTPKQCRGLLGSIRLRSLQQG